jgi:hypothetical protein
VPLIVLKQKLFLAKQNLQLEGGHEHEGIEEGPGYLIIAGDLRHFSVHALIQPSQSDNLDTGVGS